MFINVIIEPNIGVLKITHDYVTLTEVSKSPPKIHQKSMIEWSEKKMKVVFRGRFCEISTRNIL